MARLAPSMHLAGTKGIIDALDLPSPNLNDFHPDTLFDRMPLFYDL